jgi:diaminohydroxyphosphoribosylaminopyrimidine deaminase/5-amino-6-(5-phosphoribosylamino)uracil reductase
MVGAATVRADNPSLLPRPAEGRRPWRVVVGNNIPTEATVLTDEAKDRTLVFDVEDRTLCDRAPRSFGASLRAASLREMLKELAGKHDVMHVLCEGGGQLAAGLIEEGVVDEFAFFIAPVLMGADGIPNFGRTGGLMADRIHLEFLTIESVDGDILLRARPKKDSTGG